MMHFVCLTVQKSLEEQYFLRYWVDTEFAAVWSLASSVTAQSQHRSKTTKELEGFVSLFVCCFFFIYICMFSGNFGINCQKLIKTM